MGERRTTVVRAAAMTAMMVPGVAFGAPRREVRLSDQPGRLLSVSMRTGGVIAASVPREPLSQRREQLRGPHPVLQLARGVYVGRLVGQAANIRPGYETLERLVGNPTGNLDPFAPGPRIGMATYANIMGEPLYVTAVTDRGLSAEARAHLETLSWMQPFFADEEHPTRTLSGVIGSLSAEVANLAIAQHTLGFYDDLNQAHIVQEFPHPQRAENAWVNWS